MNFGFSPLVWDFLSRLCNDTASPQYREKLVGITQWLSDCGSISHKQLALIKVNAERLGRVVPPELMALAEPPHHWSNGDDDMPRAPQSRPQATPDTAVVLAELLEGIAQAISTAARRLRS